MDPVALDQAVNAHLPDVFLKAGIKSIFLARKLTHEHCRAEFAPSELPNVSSFYCRGKVEGLLRDCAERQLGFSSSVMNASGWNHTEIKCEPFTITAHAVDYPCAMVDDA